jgi:hypothetical protein
MKSMARAGRLLVLLSLAAAVAAQGGWGRGVVRKDTERYRRTRMNWGGKLPTEEELAKPPVPGQPRPKPLLVYVASSLRTRDQERFEEVVVQNESFVIAAKFFVCAQVSEATAKTHQLFEGLNWKAPAILVIDSSRQVREVARGRASAMKAVDLMRMVGQPDYVTDINETLRQAKLVLGNFDQVDAGREALKIKRTRVENALGKGDEAKARVLEKECDKDEAELDALFKKTEQEWNDLLKVKIKNA